MFDADAIMPVEGQMQRWREARYAVLGALVFLAACSQRHVRVTRTGNLPAPALVAPRDEALLR